MDVRRRLFGHRFKRGERGLLDLVAARPHPCVARRAVRGGLVAEVAATRVFSVERASKRETPAGGEKHVGGEGTARERPTTSWQSGWHVVCKDVAGRV